MEVLIYQVMRQSLEGALGEDLWLGDEAIDTCWNLPARFDWSIMGCTILLLALINLKHKKDGRLPTSGCVFCEQLL